MFRLAYLQSKKGKNFPEIAANPVEIRSLIDRDQSGRLKKALVDVAIVKRKR
jgi:hypothetical protein